MTHTRLGVVADDHFQDTDLDFVSDGVSSFEDIPQRFNIQWGNYHGEIPDRLDVDSPAPDETFQDLRKEILTEEDVIALNQALPILKEGNWRGAHGGQVGYVESVLRDFPPPIREWM